MQHCPFKVLCKSLKKWVLNPQDYWFLGVCDPKKFYCPGSETPRRFQISLNTSAKSDQRIRGFDIQYEKSGGQQSGWKCTGLNLPAGWCRAGQLMGSAHGRPAAARGGGWTHQDLHRLFPATHLQAQHTPSKKKDKNRRKGKGQRFCLVAECIQFLAVLSVLPWMIWIIWWMTPGWFERKGWIHPILLLELFNRWIKKNS